MKVVTAPEDFICLETEVKCFLAGGITNCPNWQYDVIECLQKIDAESPGKLDRLVVFNPRRDNFPIDDPNAAEEQIAWEFKWLQRMDIFTMWFSGGDSDQPICMYELGRNLQRMANRFSNDFASRVIIMCDETYRRAQDVAIQARLAFSEYGVEENLVIMDTMDPIAYAKAIVDEYEKISLRSRSK